MMGRGRICCENALKNHNTTLADECDGSVGSPDDPEGPFTQKDDICFDYINFFMCKWILKNAAWINRIPCKIVSMMSTYVQAMPNFAPLNEMNWCFIIVSKFSWFFSLVSGKIYLL